MSQKSKKEIYVLGIDGGLATFGVGLLGVEFIEGRCRARIVEAGFHGTESRHKKSRVRVVDDNKRRLDELGEFLSLYLNHHHLVAVALEAPSYNPQASITNKINLAMVYGLIYEATRNMNIPLHLYTPQELKKFWLKKRSGTKEEISEGVRTMYPEYRGWPKAKAKVVHAIDAVAIATLCVHAPEVQSAARMFEAMV